MATLRFGAMASGDLFQLLRDGSARTRAELADRTGLARSTITARVDELLATGLISAAGEARSSGGRPPTRFAFDPDARVVLAADLGATHATLTVTNLDAIPLGERTEALAIADGPTAVLEHIWTVWSRMLADARREVADVAGVGVGVPGPVEFATGRPTSPPIMPGWDGFDIPGYLSRHLTAPVLVDNDVNVMALGEFVHAWRDTGHLLFVKVATGIGAGLVSDGRLNRGAQGSAGDLGHVRAFGGSTAVCTCGNIGCLEAVAAGPAIAARLRSAGLPAESTADVVRLAREGNMLAVQEIRQAGRDIGAVLATCVNLLNPSVVVIGGLLAEAGEHLLAGAREIVYHRSPPLSTQHLLITTSHTGARAGVRGASAMVIESVLAPDAVDRLVRRSLGEQIEPTRTESA
ncbi:ROK family protein [Nakamurella sp.]|uniref:ROK family transcriptional regulator n=1 Tax=Nakamurella sp. TaxID=1869182 RepID=UPI003784A8C5